MKPLGQHAAAASEHPIDRPRQARPDRGHPAGERLAAFRLDEQVGVIGLERVVNDAEVPAVKRCSEGPLELTDKPDGPERGDVRPDLQRDVDGMLPGKAGAGTMGDAAMGAGLPAGAAAAASQRGGSRRARGSGHGLIACTLE